MAKYFDWVIVDKLVTEEQPDPQLEPTYKLTENGKKFIELLNELKAFLYVSSYPQTRYQP
jgi:predicted transcriptional regulator